MSHYSHKHASTLPYSSRHMSCVSKRERGSLGWQKIRPRAWQTALTVMHIRCIDRCTSSHCPGSSVTEGRKRLWKEAWKVGGGSRCFRAPWGWLLTDRPDPAGPDGLGGGPQVPRRVPLVLRADSCSFPWGEAERESVERVPPQFMSPLHTRADRVHFSRGQTFECRETNIHSQWKNRTDPCSMLWFYQAINHQLLKCDCQPSDKRLHRRVFKQKLCIKHNISIPTIPHTKSFFAHFHNKNH